MDAHLQSDPSTGSWHKRLDGGAELPSARPSATHALNVSDKTPQAGKPSAPECPSSRRLPAHQVTRVGIVDDHPIVRYALRRYLEEQPGLRVLAEGASGRDAIDMVREHAIDVLLLDIDTPGQSAIDALARIKANARHVGVIVLSDLPEYQLALPLLRLGARGYLNKTCDPSEVGAAIHRVAQGGRFLTPELAELVAAEVISPAAGEIHEQLSSRELQVFLKLAGGSSASDVATALSLSPKTINTYRTRLMRKLHARSNSELTYYALKHRLIH